MPGTQPRRVRGPGRPVALGGGGGHSGAAPVSPVVVAGWPVAVTSGAKLLLMVQRDRQLQLAARDTAEDNASQAQQLFERLHDNTLLIRAAVVEGLSSANPGVSTAIANALGGVAEDLGDAARAIYLHIYNSGYGQTLLPRREAPPLVRVQLAGCGPRQSTGGLAPSPMRVQVGNKACVLVQCTWSAEGPGGSTHAAGPGPGSAPALHRVGDLAAGKWPCQ